MRERLVPIIVGILIIAAVGGIGYLIVHSVKNKKVVTAGASGPTPIRIWRLNQDADPIRGVIDSYNQQVPTVKVSYVRGSADTYEIDALQSIASKKGPEIWSIPNTWLGDQSDHLVAVPNTFFWPAKAKSGPSPADRIKAIYPPGIAEQLISPKGNVYGLPTNVDTLKLYYNPNFFATRLNDFQNSLGANYSDSIFKPVDQLLGHPPTTWDELLQQLKYLNKKNAKGDLVYSGIALGTADNIPYANQILQLLMFQNGTDVISSDHTRAAFSLPITTPAGSIVRPGEKSLDFFTSFSDPAKDNYSWSPSFPQALDAFAQGNVGMVIAFTEFGRDVATKYPDFQFSSAPVPQISSTQPAVNFIQFKVETVTAAGSSPSISFEVLKQYADINGADSLSQEQSLRSPFTETLQQDISNNGDFMSRQILTGRAVFEKSRTRFDAAFHDAIVDVSQNHISSAQAIDKAANTINGILSPIPAPSPTTVHAK
jgi:ABC-type glycerol-3-phosphate transport system substrate-binding protein